MIAEVTDRCPGCGERDLDLSKAAFEVFQPLSTGVLEAPKNEDIVWTWVNGYGRLPEMAFTP